MAKFILYYIVVKIHAVGNKNAAFGNFNDGVRNFINGRRITYGIVIDTGKPGDIIRNFAFGVDQRRELVDDIMTIIFKDRNFRNLVSP